MGSLQLTQKSPLASRGDISDSRESMPEGNQWLGVGRRHFHFPHSPLCSSRRQLFQSLCILRRTRRRLVHWGRVWLISPWVFIWTPLSLFFCSVLVFLLPPITQLLPFLMSLFLSSLDLAAPRTAKLNIRSPL